jgi:hypothetical protein
MPMFAPAQILTPDERSFRQIETYFEQTYEGTPVKGNHKQVKRHLHYWQNRLDSKGHLFNHTLANVEALQQLYIDTFPAEIEGNWQQIGPLISVGTDFNQAGIGRVNCIAFASEETWYAGTAGGGLWRSDVAGIYFPGLEPYPWYPLTDSLPVLGVSGISVHPDDVDDVFILTGDGETSNYATRGTHPSIGILHTTDGGVSWDTTVLQYGLTELNAGYKLVRYPGSIDTMFAACTDSLYRTTDSWNTVSAMSYPIDTTCYDIEFKPGDPQTVYAACLGSLRRSTDGGENFTVINANLDLTNFAPWQMNRMALAVSPEDPEVLYVVIAQTNGGLLSFQVSSDGGDSFTETIGNAFNILCQEDPLTETSGQGNYDLGLWADPSDASVVIVGGINLWKSTTSGLPWTRIAYWNDEPPEYTHADIHAVESEPFSGGLIACTDGGIYFSTHGGSEWENRGHGLGITQFYHLNVYPGFVGIPHVTGGAQDNGTSTVFGLNDPVFEMIGGGDGFRTYRGTLDGFPVRYLSVQNGKLYRHTFFTDAWISAVITPESEENGDESGRGAWDTPYQPHPYNIREVLAGYDNLYYSSDAGDDWFELDFPDGFSYDMSRLITQLEWWPQDANVAYFCISDSTRRDLYRTSFLYVGVISGSLEDAICTVDRLDTISIMPGLNTSGQCSDIVAHRYNSSQVWITYSGYNAGMKVYYNADMVSDSPWVNISFNLPNVPVHCAMWDVDGLFAGTDIGVFFLPHGEETWIYFSKGLPTVAVTELQMHNTIFGEQLYASTYGRGIWWSTPPATDRRTRWYVDSAAIGTNDGTDWVNAFTNFEQALDTILPGDSIWVAAGTYFPESNSGFELQYNNVKIWGGFSGVEDSISQRDVIQNVTILSGDIGVLGDISDNAKHVVKFGGHNAHVLLDGFHIIQGNANGSNENAKGGGIYYSSDSPAGKPIIRNCVIRNNLSNSYGAGVYIADYFSGDDDMYLENCSFESNISSDRGGGLCIDAYKNIAPILSGNAGVFIDRCTFADNVAFAEGGGIFIESLHNSIARVTIDSTLFNGNALTFFAGNGAAIGCDILTGSSLVLTSTHSDFMNHSANSGDGGAIHIDGSAGSVISTFTHCLFDSNDAYNGGAMMFYSPGSTSAATLICNNCIFTDNSVTFGGGAVYLWARAQGHTNAIFDNCMFNGNSAISRAGAVFYDGDNSGHFISSLDSCTFSQNTANENGAIRYFSRTLGFDIQGTGELNINHCLFEENTVTGSSSGAALGLISELSTIDADISYSDFIDNDAGAKGGAVAHVHTANDSSSISVVYDHCNFIHNTVPFAGGSSGGALYFERTDATLSNCVFTHNEAQHGGAVANYVSAQTDIYQHLYENCQFVRNKASDFGGAMYLIHDSPSMMYLNVTECSFDSNYTTSQSAGRGGALYLRGLGKSVQTFSNSTFVDNIGKNDAWAIYIENSLSTTDTLFVYADACIFTNNDAGASSETIEQFGNGANARVFTHWTNCIFENNIAGVIYLNRKSGGQSVATFTDCQINLNTGALQMSGPSEPFLMIEEVD